MLNFVSKKVNHHHKSKKYIYYKTRLKKNKLKNASVEIAASCMSKPVMFIYSFFYFLESPPRISYHQIRDACITLSSDIRKVDT